jgi:hypothetical protein
MSRTVLAYLTVLQSVIASVLGLLAISVSELPVPEKLAYSGLLLSCLAVICFMAWCFSYWKADPKGTAYKCPACEVTFYSEQPPTRCPICSGQITKPNYGDFGNPTEKPEGES